MTAPVGICYLSRNFSEFYWELEVCKGKPPQQFSKGSAAKSYADRERICIMQSRIWESCKIGGPVLLLLLQETRAEVGSEMLRVAEIYGLPAQPIDK